MDLPFNKIIVDSRHASAGTSSSFEISLPETLSLPHNAVCYVCDLQVTNNFSSVDPNKNTFYFIENGLSQNSLNRAILTSKSYTPETLASELQTKLNEVSIHRPTADYVVVFDEELGSLKISRASLADQTFFLANGDLLQQLSSTDFLFQTYDADNGPVPWTMDFSNPKSAMSFVGLGPRSSVNKLMDHLFFGQRPWQRAPHGSPGLAREPLHIFAFPHVNELQGFGPRRQPFCYRARGGQFGLR